MSFKSIAAVMLKTLLKFKNTTNKINVKKHDKIMILGLVVLLLVSVGAVPEVNHLIEIDHQGHTVAMDVIHDSEDKTVLAIVGDVSKYKNGIQTVNFHDYKTGYGALKDINKQTCVITKSPVPMGTDKQYRVMQMMLDLV
ncbi:hypothetical protein AM593_00986, partial [Mytilus galloprovincialis]